MKTLIIAATIAAGAVALASCSSTSETRQQVNEVWDSYSEIDQKRKCDYYLEKSQYEAARALARDRFGLEEVLTIDGEQSGRTESDLSPEEEAAFDEFVDDAELFLEEECNQ